MSKKLIIFTDSGDTIIDEATQIRDENVQTITQYRPGAHTHIEDGR